MSFRRLRAIGRSLRLLPDVLPALVRSSDFVFDREPVFSHSFPQLNGSAVLREQYILDLVRGRRVLHVGFLDSPFTADKVREGALLHARIGQCAASLFGIDVDEAALELYRSLTGDHRNAVMDFEGLRDGTIGGGFEVIVLGEVLEHLRNPGDALVGLRSLRETSPGAVLCVTVPNALFAGSFLAGLRGEEIVHPEHYYYFSPATLSRLLTDCGFTDIEMRLYASPATRRLPGLSKNGVIAVCRL